MNKTIIIALVAVLLIGAGAGAFFLLSGGDTPAEAGAAADAEPAQDEPQGDPIYTALSPAFLVNFDDNGSTRYLQLELQVMAYEQAVIDKVEANMPAVRNQVILLLGNQEFEPLTRLEGKENLRVLVKDAVNESLKLTGKDSVQDVFFTSFVVQ